LAGIQKQAAKSLSHAPGAGDADRAGRALFVTWRRHDRIQGRTDSARDVVRTDENAQADYLEPNQPLSEPASLN
jgi:hypothetical protein